MCLVSLPIEITAQSVEIPFNALRVGRFGLEIYLGQDTA
ncbi:hypothetical protein Z949_3517 [Sulfitobacter guttiformis KCTC 32187]|nr:hypothetical protein Z949_3517 [Sulfitobacter guttiformis KCTC 32187]